ncbi:RusA family crossover junction endodeoxyribonuclease [Cupriavidus pauculus]|uniref:RusA family crossover junction endodeoxyribonuclease n=1 Tax=Cupriavidus pauculus TaxID=82633 RepID=UPI001F1FFE09|nr:RusA family crossover junction endodeoxyribonuclease [Cupriavidus pauculus]
MTNAEFESWMTCADPEPAEKGTRANEIPGMTVGFFVPGQPVAKGRPIAGRAFGGRVTMRTPEKTVAYEGLVAHACHAAMKGMTPLSGPLKLDIDMRVMIPASWPKKKQEKARAGVVRPTKKPDLDNVVKGLCDGMNGIAYGDDSQIVLLVVRKTYSDAPGVLVMLQILEGEPA